MNEARLLGMVSALLRLEVWKQEGIWSVKTSIPLIPEVFLWSWWSSRISTTSGNLGNI